MRLRTNKELADYEKDIQEYLINTKHNNYQRLWGEQQARATQYRMDMTPEQRAKETWQETLKRVEGKFDESIIRYDDGVSMMSPVKSKSQKEMRGVYNVQNNNKRSTLIYKDAKFADEVRKLAGITDKRVLADLNELLDKHPSYFKDTKSIQRHITKVKDSVTHYLNGSNPDNAILAKNTDELLSLIGIEKDGEVYNKLVHASRTKNPNEIKRLIRRHLEGSPTPSLLKDGADGADALSSISRNNILPKSKDNIKLLEDDMLTKQAKFTEGDTSKANLKRKQEFLEAKDKHARAVILEQRASDAKYKPSVEKLDSEIKLGDDGRVLFANGGETLGGGFAGGADSAINERDYDGDGKHDYKDILYGVATGAISVNALKKAAPKLFATPKGGNKVGTFVGAKPDEAGAFSDVATKKLMKEIDDGKSKLNIKKLTDDADADPYLMTEQKLEDVFSHDVLFEKYPELKNINVVYESKKGIDSKDLYYGAYYDPKENIIVLGNGLTKDEMKSGLLHEIQHAIQRKEGWARGGSVSEMNTFIEKLNPDKIKQSFRDRADIYKKLNKNNELSKELKDELQQEYEVALKRYTKLATKYDQKTAYDLYQSLWGEQQARATQYRMDMTPEQRAKETWQETLERVEAKFDESIIKYDDGVAMSIEMENKYIDKRTGRVLENKIEAEPLPQATKTFSDFRKDFPIADKDGNVEFEYNGHKIKFNLNGVFTHFTNNTNHQNRSIYSGAFHRVMQDPLAVVKQPHKGKTIVYKPFNTKEGKLHLASIEFSDGGFTFFDLPIGKVKDIIKTPDGNVIYYKHSKGAGTQRSVLHATKNSGAHTSTSESISKSNSKNKPNPILQKLTKKK